MWVFYKDLIYVRMVKALGMVVYWLMYMTTYNGKHLL